MDVLYGVEKNVNLWNSASFVDGSTGGWGTLIFSGIEPLRPIWRWVGMYERDCGETYPEVSSFSAQFSAIPGLGYPFVRAGGDILKSWHLLYPTCCNRHKV